MIRDRSRGQYFEEVLSAYTTRGRFSGCAAVAKGGRLLHFYAAGQTITGWSPTTPLRLGSISKQFTAVAILQLVEAGHLSLTQPVGDCLPGLAASWGDRVTLQQLLSHSAGIPSVFTGHAGVVDPAPEESARPVRPADLLARFTSLPLRFEPGLRFEYSNSGYSLLASVVEQVSGERYAEYMRASVFGPAGLQHTAIYDEGELPADLVAGQVGARVAPVLHPTWQRGSGDIVSCVADLVAWDAALRDSAILTEPWRKRMENPPGAACPEAIRYGYGVRLGSGSETGVLYHDSSLPGLLGVYRRIPSEGIVVALFTNRVPSPACTPDGTRRLNQLSCDLLEWARGSGTPSIPAPPQAVALSAKDLDPFQGRYELGERRYFHVHRQQDKLYARLEGRAATLTGLVVDDLEQPCGLGLGRFLSCLEKQSFEEAESCLSSPGLRALGPGGLQRLWMQSVVGFLGEFLSYEVIQREAGIARARCRFVQATMDVQAVFSVGHKIEGFHLIPPGLGPAASEWELLAIGESDFLADGYPHGVPDVFARFEMAAGKAVAVSLEGTRILKGVRYVPDVTP